MNAIRSFIESHAALSDKPQHYVLASGDGAIIATFSLDDDPATNLEKALRADLAFTTGPCNYTLMAQDSAGGVKQRIQLRQHGTAPKTASSEASTVNGNLVALVGKLSSASLEHFEKLYKRQDDVIGALLESNGTLSRTLAEIGDEPKGNNPAVAMAEQRLSRLVEVGLGAAIGRLSGGGAPQAERPAVSVGGKHVGLRELIASSLSDEEIDKIICVILASGCGDNIMGALSPANMAKALELMGGEA